MNEQKYWKTKWNKILLKRTSNFARRSFSQIKNRNFKKLLDLGCGNGIDSLYFARKGLNVTSVDFSESGIQKLNELIMKNGINNLKAIHKDIRKIKFKDNSFGVIYAHLSLHLFEDKVTTKIFNKLFRILKKDGMIFIKCKSIEDTKYGQGKKVGEDIYVKSCLRNFFSKDYMKEKLEKFKILKLRKTSSKIYNEKSAFIEAVAIK